MCIKSVIYILIYWYWYIDLFIYFVYIDLLTIIISIIIITIIIIIIVIIWLFLLLLANFITLAQLVILQIAHFIILSKVRWWWNFNAKFGIMKLQRTNMQYNVTTASCWCILNVMKLTYKHKSFFAWYCIKCFEDVIPFSTISDHELS